jgi:hypothetical protein
MGRSFSEDCAAPNTIYAWWFWPDGAWTNSRSPIDVEVMQPDGPFHLYSGSWSMSGTTLTARTCARPESWSGRWANMELVAEYDPATQTLAGTLTTFGADGAPLDTQALRSGSFEADPCPSCCHTTECVDFLEPFFASDIYCPGGECEGGHPYSRVTLTCPQ